MATSRIIRWLVVACVVRLAASSAMAQTEGPRRAQGLQVWTLAGLERMLRDSPAGQNGKAVVRAARNEWESFQIALRSARPVRITDVVAGPLHGPASAVLSGDNVHLYREHQLNITKPSPRNDNFQAGWYPDALIPFRHPMTGERLTTGRFKAVPFDLPADETHAFWADLHVPRDAAPGRYTGEFTIRIEGGAPVVVPVEIEVWDFALPERAAMFTEMCGSPAERMSRYYNNLIKKGVVAKAPDFGPIAEQCARLESDHRLNCPPPSDLMAERRREDGSFDLTPEQLDGLRRWAAKYHVNAVSIPAPQRRFKDPVADREKINNWLKSWERAMDAAGLGDRLLYIYILDEPNDADGAKRSATRVRGSRCWSPSKPRPRMNRGAIFMARWTSGCRFSRCSIPKPQPPARNSASKSGPIRLSVRARNPRLGGRPIFQS